MSASIAGVIPFMPSEETVQADEDWLTPDDCDLRSFQDMKLDVARLRRSRSWLRAKAQPELGFYMMNLWTYAFHEVPAGSIDNDDAVIANAAMCSPEKWPEVKAKVMRGWKLCPEKGRWYHPYLCKVVKEAWATRVQYKEWGKRGNEARWGGRGSPKDRPPIAKGSPKGSQGRGKGEGEGEDKNQAASGPAEIHAEILAKITGMGGMDANAAAEFAKEVLAQLDGDLMCLLKFTQNAHRKWVGQGMRSDPIAYIRGAVRSHLAERSANLPAKPPRQNQATAHIEGYLAEMEGRQDRPVIDHWEG